MGARQWRLVLIPCIVVMTMGFWVDVLNRDLKCIGILSLQFYISQDSVYAGSNGLDVRWSLFSDLQSYALCRYVWKELKYPEFFKKLSACFISAKIQWIPVEMYEDWLPYIANFVTLPVSIWMDIFTEMPKLVRKYSPGIGALISAWVKIQEKARHNSKSQVRGFSPYVSILDPFCC